MQGWARQVGPCPMAPLISLRRQTHTYICIYIFSFFSFFFWLHCMACGIDPGPLAVKAQSPNHWTAREFLRQTY